MSADWLGGVNASGKVMGVGYRPIVDTEVGRRGVEAGGTRGM